MVGKVTEAMVLIGRQFVRLKIVTTDCFQKTSVLTKRERRKAGEDMDTASCKKKKDSYQT